MPFSANTMPFSANTITASSMVRLRVRGSSTTAFPLPEPPTS
jgi:hypothetical protein